MISLQYGNLFCPSSAALSRPKPHNPIAGAIVTLRETGTNFERVITTSASGVFTATLLPLGTYDVTASATGFNEIQRTGIAD